MSSTHHAHASAGHDHHDRDHDHDHDHDHHDHDHPFDWQEGLRIALVAVAAVWFGWWEPYPAVSVIGVAGLVIGG